MRFAIGWMSACTDEESKRFLLDIAMDNSKDSLYRRIATEVYLRRADLQETKDFFANLLADEARLPADHRETIIRIIENVREEMDEQKREAVDAALRVIKAKGEH